MIFSGLTDKMNQALRSFRNKGKLTEAIMLSMTEQEREHPEIISASRRRRIAAGCGLQVVDVNRLLKSFEMLQQLTKSMSKGRFRGIPGMGGMPGMGGHGKMKGFGRKKRLK